MVIGAALMATASASPAEAAQLPGMCNGRSDSNLLVIAHANGHPGAVPKFILNVTTDEYGIPSGTLILGQGSQRIQVTSLCRVWQHLADQPSQGSCDETYPEGAVTAHAVGVTQAGGTTLLVRADVRQTSEGLYFRARYKVWSPGEEQALADEGGGCEDEGWTWIPGGEGWAPLDQMKVMVTTEAA